MSSWQNAVITNKGLVLQAKMFAGKTLKITKAVAGSGYVNPTLLQQQTAVTTIKNALTIKSVRFPETGVCAIRVALTNAGVSTGYTANQIGIYAEDPDDGEILYFIAQADSNGGGVDVPAEANVPSYASEWEFYFKFGNADGVNVTISSANSVSRQEMEEVLDETVGTATKKVLDEKVDAPVSTSGKVIAATGSANAPFHGLRIHGKTEQQQTTGAQLFDIATWKDEVFVLHGTKELDGNKIKLTATEEDCYTACAAGQFPVAARIAVTPGESYVLSWETDSESSAKNEAYVFFDGLTDGMISVNSALKQIAFTVPEGKTFITFRFGVKAVGDSASYWNIMVNHGYTKAEYEPYTGGAPSPSPETPQELKSVGDTGSVEVSVLGANLLDYEKWIKSPVQRGTAEFKDYGVAITSGSGGDAYTDYTMSYSRIPCISGTKYVLSWEHTGARGMVYIFPNSSQEGNIHVTTNDASSIEYVPAEGVENFSFRVGVAAANATAVYKNIRINVYEDAGFTEYKQPQTMTVDTPNGLPGIPVANGGNYTDESGQQWICDEVDLGRGVYVQRTFYMQLTGEENIVRPDDATWSEGCYAVYPSENPEHKHTTIMCSFLRGVSNEDLANDVYTSGIGTHGTPGLLVRFGAEVNTLDLVKAAWKAAIEAGGKVLAALLEPVETPLTAEEIAAYAALRTHEPATTITNSVGAEMTSRHYTPNASLPITGGTMTGYLTVNGLLLTKGRDYEAELPASGIPGRLFFKKV